MGSLIKLVAKAMRRYDHDTMLVLADLCEERELINLARQLQVVRVVKGRSVPTLITFLALYDLRKMIRPARKMRDAMIRYNMWIGEHKWPRRPEEIQRYPSTICARCGTTSTDELLQHVIADRYVCRHEADCDARLQQLTSFR